MFDEALRRAGNKDYTLKYPQRRPWPPTTASQAYIDGEFVPGYLETITDWILERVDLPG